MNQKTIGSFNLGFGVFFILVGFVALINPSVLKVDSWLSMFAFGIGSFNLAVWNESK
jgi:hypothetical protein